MSAKAFAIKTIYGSRVNPKIAGIESSAKIKSVIPSAKSARVKLERPFFLKKERILPSCHSFSPGSSLIKVHAVYRSIAPNKKKTATYFEMTAAPIAIKIPRSIKATVIPKSRTNCSCFFSICNLERMIKNMKRLSIDSEYSVIQPAKNSLLT